MSSAFWWGDRRKTVPRYADPRIGRSGSRQFCRKPCVILGEWDFAELLSAAQSGAEWAVSLLYRDLHPRLAKYLAAREPGAAEDIESEVWLAIAQRIGAFVGDEQAFRAWAFAIARRRLMDYRRTAVRRATTPAPNEQLDGPDRVDVEGAVLEALSAEEAASFVVTTLTEDQAEVVLLRVLGDLDVTRVSELLHKSPGAIRVLQHRALRHLERALAEERVTQ
jgi:RNA polymerase sigma-70 factor (ECF subfamily)